MIIEMQMGEGVAKGFLATPEKKQGAKLAGVIVYMDAFGLRQAFYDMAERIVANGYAVLVPDLFYRFGAYGPYDARPLSRPKTPPRKSAG